MEKRKIPYISFTISILSMIYMVALAIEAFSAYIELKSRHASGHEYLGLAAYPLFYGVAALIGIITTSFCGIMTNVTWVKVVSFIMLFVFVLGPVVCLLCFGNLESVMRAFNSFANLFIG